MSVAGGGGCHQLSSITISKRVEIQSDVLVADLLEGVPLGRDGTQLRSDAGGGGSAARCSSGSCRCRCNDSTASVLQIASQSCCRGIASVPESAAFLAARDTHIGLQTCCSRRVPGADRPCCKMQSGASAGGVYCRCHSVCEGATERALDVTADAINRGPWKHTSMRSTAATRVRLDTRTSS